MITQILPRAWRITLPLPGRRPGPVNAYVFGGDRVTLVDTGTSRTLEHLVRGLAQVGLTLSDIDEIVLTHGHIDHAGAARDIVAQSRARVFCHPEDVRTVETVEENPKRALTRFLVLCGVPAKVHVLLWGLFFYFKNMARTCRVTGHLVPGEVRTLGDYQARVISTSGHTKGSVCFFLEDEGVVLSGDTLLGHITPNALIMLEAGECLPVRSSQDEFYASIEKIEALKPKVVHPGHGRPVEDLFEITAMYRRTFDDRQNLVFDLARKGSFTIYEMACLLFPDIEHNIRFPLEMYLAISEVYSHIQVLHKKGRVMATIHNGRLWTHEPL